MTQCWPEGYKKNFVRKFWETSLFSPKSWYSLFQRKLLYVELLQLFIYCIGNKAKHDADTERGWAGARVWLCRSPASPCTFWLCELVHFLHCQFEPDFNYLQPETSFLQAGERSPLQWGNYYSQEKILLTLCVSVWHQMLFRTFALTLQYHICEHLGTNQFPKAPSNPRIQFGDSICHPWKVTRLFSLRCSA